MNSELNLHNCKVHEFISDHTLVTIDTTLNKTPWEPTERVIRDTTRLAKETLEKFYTAPDIDDNFSLEQACDQFHDELCKMLDREAPQKRSNMQTGQKNLGSTSISMNRGELSQTGIESTKKHGGNDYWRAYTIERNKLNRLLKFHKRQIITKQIMDNSKDTKQFFRIVNNLTGCNTHNPLPPGNTSKEIAESFAEFSNKITKI